RQPRRPPRRGLARACAARTPPPPSSSIRVKPTAAPCPSGSAETPDSSAGPLGSRSDGPDERAALRGRRARPPSSPPPRSRCEAQDEGAELRDPRRRLEGDVGIALRAALRVHADASRELALEVEERGDLSPRDRPLGLHLTLERRVQVGPRQPGLLRL